MRDGCSAIRDSTSFVTTWFFRHRSGCALTGLRAPFGRFASVFQELVEVRRHFDGLSRLRLPHKILRGKFVRKPPIIEFARRPLSANCSTRECLMRCDWPTLAGGVVD